jgi:hypothetical protein
MQKQDGTALAVCDAIAERRSAKRARSGCQRRFDVTPHRPLE